MTPAQIVAKEHELATCNLRLSDLRKNMNANRIPELNMLRARVAELRGELAAEYTRQTGIGSDSVSPAERLREVNLSAYGAVIAACLIIGAIAAGLLIGLQLPLSLK